MCIRDRLYPDLLALEGFIVLRAGQLTAKAGAAHFQIIAPVSYTHLDVYKRQDVFAHFAVAVN